MKKYYYILLFSLMFSIRMQAQIGSTKSSVYLELGGVNAIYSINYLQKLGTTEKRIWCYRVGGMYINSNNVGLNTSIQAIKITDRKIKTQFGIGLSYSDNYMIKSNVSLTFNWGIRRDFKNGYLLLSVNPSLVYYLYEANYIGIQFYYPSIGFGYNLSNK